MWKNRLKYLVMAKLTSGYLGGFSGRLGPAVGYMWNGKWCVRSHQPMVRNPRTAAQTAHRTLFKQQVQLAAHMRWAVVTALTGAAREAGMTSYNLFVSLNQPAFALDGEAMSVRWERLRLSIGPLAPVALGQATVDEHNTLKVSFEKNPLGMRAKGSDLVYLYVYCPDLQRGYMASPVHRRTGHVSLLLPEGFGGCRLQLYAMVSDGLGLWSESAHATVDADGHADGLGSANNTNNEYLAETSSAPEGMLRGVKNGAPLQRLPDAVSPPLRDSVPPEGGASRG